MVVVVKRGGDAATAHVVAASAINDWRMLTLVLTETILRHLAANLMAVTRVHHSFLCCLCHHGLHDFHGLCPVVPGDVAIHHSMAFVYFDRTKGLATEVTHARRWVASTLP